ncbi:DUF998 domain-containing protein [Amycolatopsis sp. NPDC005003]
MNSPKTHAVSPLHGRIALGGIGLAVAISIDLHLRLSGQVSPIWQTLSEYVYGKLGTSSAAPLFSIMCLALSLGSVALLAGIAKAHRPGTTAVCGLLGVWSAGLFVCGLVPVDPDGQARSLAGQVHNIAALTAFIALPVAAFVLTKKDRERCPWEPRRTTIRRLATASLVAVGVVLGGFVFTLTLGLFERLLFTVDVALLLTMVRPLVAVSRR